MTDWSVRVPGSSANLGPAFDGLAVALSVYVTARTEGPPADETHPAVRAFRSGGGEGPLSVAADYPGGRGMGYSGAARVAGLLAACAQQGRSLAESREEAFLRATELEGHADNAAASVFGGVVAAAGGRAVRVPLGRAPTVVLWVPAAETSTKASRRQLPSAVAFADAVFNISHTALLVAALAAGEVDALRVATADRLHQDHRLVAVPESRAALRAALDAGAWCAWLSGSGPSIAAFADPARARRVASALPAGGRSFVLEIDGEGAVLR
jgi:homoserine kinase